MMQYHGLFLLIHKYLPVKYFHPLAQTLFYRWIWFYCPVLVFMPLHLFSQSYNLFLIGFQHTEIFLTDGLPQLQYTQQPLLFCQFQLAYAGYYSVSQMTKALEAEVSKLEETKT